MKAAYAYVALAALSLVLAGAAMLYASWDINSNNHKFCEVISAYAHAPSPSTGTGVERYKDFADLGRRLGC